MASAKIFRINYKSDFILTLESDAGWMTPFCIKFWTGAPSQAYYVGWDGDTYNHCSFDPSEPTKLLVQFDDHHLPIGDLKYQVAYHFTVDDFPNDTEDEVINPASITTEIDGETYQVMLDFTGETAPEIQFALPAYANEAQRIANEQQRIASETQRIANEETRIANEQTRINQEQTRQQNEQQRINQEQARVNEYATLKADAVAATGAANDAATLAQQKAEYAQQQGGYAKDQGDYAKNQGDYAKEQGDTALADHQRAESDHGIAVDDHTTAASDHSRAESDHTTAAADHTQAGQDHTTAASDHTQAGNDHTRAESDHGIAAADHTQAGNDHTRAESDHTRAESDHAAVEVYVDSLGAFDISAYHATGGVLAKYADLTAALGTNGANIPEAIRKGGMSVKYVQTSDNKYVQYRYMGTATTGSPNPFLDIANWQGVDDEPTAGSGNLVKSGGIASVYGSYVENPDFIEVKTDRDNKILWAIKADGDIYFGVGVPTQVKEYIQGKIEELGLSNVADIVTFLGTLLDDDKTLQELLDEKVNVEEGKTLIDADVAENLEFIENGEYLEVETDSDDKILGGRKADGTKFENVGNENPVCSEKYVKENRWLDITIDSDNKIIEGITVDGKKTISDFDESTRLLIRQIANDGNLPTKISIPLLDANFVSPIPCIIDGTKGDDDAKYSFTLPLQNGAYNIRFKFKITENILNQNKTSVIAKFGGVNAVVATPVKLNQLLASSTYQGEVKMMYWPSLRGGIRLNGSSVARTTDSGDKQNIGNFAFYVKYTGESTNVTIENTGQALIIKVDGVATNLSFSTYPSVAELYEAVKSLTDFEVSFNEIETRQCSELATFRECVLVSKYYTGVNGGKNDPIEEYYDTAPFFIPYAVSEEWHQAEIVKIGEDVYVCVDGLTITIAPSDNILSLGGECGCLFKELEVNTTSSSDAEFIDGVLISSVNPHIIIHEGHDIIQTPTNEIADTSGNLGTTVDRLQLVYSKMIGKGYVPVSLDEIADYYAGNRILPKRCFTSIFDDYRWVNCLDLSNRAIFTRLGIKPGLAIITSDPSPIEHNGSIITQQEAATICRHYQFGLYSHTRNHRDNRNIKPSTYFSELTADVYDGDIKGIDNSILVYPYGHVYTYMTDVMKWLGFRLGINIQRSGVNIKNRSRFNLTRIEIGVTENITDIFNSII